MTLSKEEISNSTKLVRTCSIWRTLNDVGDVPTLLILQAIWMQQNRFSQINEFTCLPKAVLSGRLQNLLKSGILEKQTIKKNSGSGDYRLTRKGRDLFWVALMLLRWESKWSRVEKAFRVSLVHTGCGNKILPQPSCACCNQPFSSDDVSWEMGPGIGLMRPNYTRRRQSKHKLVDKEITLLFTESAEILGDRWSALVLRALFTGLRQFDQILDDTAIATNILSSRLSWLREIDVLKSDTGAKSEYELTEKGAEFFPILVMLQAWGDRHYGSPEGPPVLFRHNKCGEHLLPVVVCDSCGQVLQLDETAVSLEF